MESSESLLVWKDKAHDQEIRSLVVIVVFTAPENAVNVDSNFGNHASQFHGMNDILVIINNYGFNCFVFLRGW